MKEKIGDKQRLQHIRDAITEIEDYIKDADKETFLNNSMMRFASIKQLEIVGEASVHITAETRALFTNVEWRQMIGMRNILVHEYFGITNNLIWQVITNDLSALKEKVVNVLENWIDENDDPL